MNNNRNQNRRRGRGQNRQQGGGGQQLNRIDSRARGNAPQLLEKYKKLAHDAHLNGDRVQAEYFLQFADHYFRVIADARSRQEEQRKPRDERFGESAYEESDDGEFVQDGDMSGFDQPYRRDDGGQREPRREEAREFRNREDRGRDERPPRRERFEESPPQEEPESASDDGGEGGAEFEPTGGNPFTRNNRASRGLRPRRGEREAVPGVEGEPSDEASLGLDPSLLPPAISESRDQALSADAEDAPAPRRRGRPRKTAPDDDAGSLEAVNG